MNIFWQRPSGPLVTVLADVGENPSTAEARTTALCGQSGSTHRVSAPDALPDETSSEFLSTPQRIDCAARDRGEMTDVAKPRHALPGVKRTRPDLPSRLEALPHLRSAAGGSGRVFGHPCRGRHRQPPHHEWRLTADANTARDRAPANPANRRTNSFPPYRRTETAGTQFVTPQSQGAISCKQ